MIWFLLFFKQFLIFPWNGFQVPFATAIFLEENS